MTTQLFKAGLLAAALLTLAPAQAASDVYVGGNIGLGGINVDCAAAECDDSSVGYKIYGGYKFSTNLAVEVAYINYGKATQTYLGRDYDLKATGFGVSLAYLGEIDKQWSWSARAGLASNKGDDDLNNQSESKMKFTAGLGVGYAVSPELSIQGAVDLSQIEINGDSGGVYLFSLGLQYAF